MTDEIKDTKQEREKERKVFFRGYDRMVVGFTFYVSIKTHIYK